MSTYACRHIAPRCLCLHSQAAVAATAWCCTGSGCTETR